MVCIMPYYFDASASKEAYTVYVYAKAGYHLPASGTPILALDSMLTGLLFVYISCYFFNSSVWYGIICWPVFFKLSENIVFMNALIICILEIRKWVYVLLEIHKWVYTPLEIRKL